MSIKSINYQLMLRYLGLSSLLMAAACSSRLMQLAPPPSGINLTGNWEFISQDEVAFERFKQRIGQAAMRVHAQMIEQGQNGRSNFQRAMPERMLLDMLTGLLTLPRKELYFKQTKQMIEIDYGVAGYHSFPIGKATELLLNGAELDATAGWKDGDLQVQILVTSEFQIQQKFRLMDANNLLETTSVQLSHQRSLNHQRWYRRKSAGPISND